LRLVALQPRPAKLQIRSTDVITGMFTPFNVRLGSEADAQNGMFAFPPNSDIDCVFRQGLWAKSGHSAVHSITSSANEHGNNFRAVAKRQRPGKIPAAGSL
jgi:hypothetical protein